MLKAITFALLLLTLTSICKAQNLQSPSQYLGYTIGTKYTPHYRITDYIKYVAQNSSQQVKYVKYGTTNEGRPLQLLFVSSPTNINNLEEIRKNNLQQAKIITGNANNKIALVWLSYNVHGNEPSCSEAAMQTLYELITKHTNDWLQNTVVIIDPCLNPDGRDRYVNWYNGVVGTQMNVNPISREHAEPWPGGRVNHYYFDLNRDWAWQTQVETQQRIKVYNQWLPHIHVDFHEQGINEPYYFAPAAEPMHEVITPWQRDFQTTIGKNNAKYFDNKGWYYFTKERFDLFYPSYGDTYPTYNGSIGMTYEQGGHSRGGLGVTIDNGDVLTLVDRVAHHHTTGISTVEISSQNATALNTNFANYYNNSVNGVGSNYKTYVLTTNNTSNLQALQNLLTSNGIAYTNAQSVTGNGLNYATNKIENIVLEKNTLVVSAYQPKSLLAKVLLEPKSKLTDTATYDITAWSLPYAYGIKTYASTEKLTSTPKQLTDNNITVPVTTYALYVSYNSIKQARVLSQLLINKIKIYINEKEITTANQTFAKGTIIIPKKENNNNWSIVEKILTEANITSFAVSSGYVQKGPDMGSPDMKYISAPRIACATGNEVSANASGEIWNFFDNEIEYPATIINADRLNLSTLKNIDVLILPDGYYEALSGKTADELKTWVRMGGRLIAIEGAATQIAKTDWGLKLKKEATEEDLKDKKNEDANILRKYENRDLDEIPNYIPGAIYEVALDNSHPLAFGYSTTYYTLKQNSDVLQFNTEAWHVGVIKKDKVVSGFAGYKVLQKINNGTVIAVQELGRGNIIYFLDNPIFRNFWHNGKLLLFNAAFLVGNNAVRL